MADLIRNGEQSERRKEARAIAVFRLVHIEREGDEGLARCRNISDNGMKLELAMAVNVGDAIKVSFSSSHVFAGTVIWADGVECGLALNSVIDSTAMLASSALEARAEQFAGLQIKSSVRAKVGFDGRVSDTLVSELSQHGMKLTHSGGFHPSSRVSVILAGKEKHGVVRWRKGDVADLVLLEPFSVTELGSISALAAA
jgi:hypothetical protein